MWASLIELPDSAAWRDNCLERIRIMGLIESLGENRSIVAYSRQEEYFVYLSLLVC